MVSEYRVTVRIAFSTAAARNEWYTKVKTAINNAKASSAAYKSASIYKDDYQVQEDITSENL